MTETIAAISTALSNSGISIIRISGEDAFYTAAKLLHWSERKISTIESHTIHYAKAFDDDEQIDEVLASFMRSPKTYTREDVVEINCHGGVFVTRRVLNAVLKCGARLAEPGEFTKRAFLNGRIDLSQAEAVMDIIRAKNYYALKSAENELSGSIGEVIAPIKNEILSDMAYIEAALDDPENIPFDEDKDSELREHVEKNIAKLSHIVDNFDNGRIIKEGVKTVIVGKPNVGKSSFLNYISGSDVAIVTDIPGTTRDAIEESVSLGDITLNFVDTAGIRETDNEIEKIGIERAKKHLNDADLVIFVVDSSIPLSDEDREITELIRDKKRIAVLNKSDLSQVVTKEELELFADCRVIEMSAAKHTGVDELKDAIKEMFFKNELDLTNDVYISNIRQQNEVRSALESLKLVIKSMDDKVSEDFYTIDLMNAYNSLGAITGDTTSEDLADKIFSEFCMGK